MVAPKSKPEIMHGSNWLDSLLQTSRSSELFVFSRTECRLDLFCNESNFPMPYTTLFLLI